MPSNPDRIANFIFMIGVILILIVAGECFLRVRISQSAPSVCGQPCGPGIMCPVGCGCAREINQPWGVCRAASQKGVCNE